MAHLNVVILAAGKGTRMRSDLPKVLHPLLGKPMILRVIQTAHALAKRPIVIYGHEGQRLKDALLGVSVDFCHQKEQLGTGHALACALPLLPKDGKTLVLYGDVPLIGVDLLKQLADKNTHGVSILTYHHDNPAGLGRIVKNGDDIIAIIEEKDADEKTRAIGLINTGIYCIDNYLLHQYLPKLDNHNSQNEYYLTDVIKLARADGIKISELVATNPLQIEGVNSPKQLYDLSKRHQAQLLQALQDGGVRFVDMDAVHLTGDVACGRDVVIGAGVSLGDVTIDDGVQIGQGCVIDGAKIGKNAVILPYCVIRDSQIGDGVSVGPFAHIRPKTVLEDGAKVGNFCETKNAVLGLGAKMNHLSYLGDAVVGARTNIGAGAITCNYDGKDKHRTSIGEGAFIGSNVALIAPVMLGNGARVGAGSVITCDVPEGVLAIGRAHQVNKTKNAKSSE